LFKGSPAINLGIFNAGTASNDTDQNIAYGLIGETIPFFGRVHGGPYVGNGKAKSFVGDNGAKEAKGYMVGYDHGFLPVNKGEFNRLVLAADYASGRNSIGGGGVGIYYFFTKDISLLTGPVWFNDKTINGNWKWTIQLDINTNLLARLKRGKS